MGLMKVVVVGEGGVEGVGVSLGSGVRGLSVYKGRSRMCFKNCNCFLDKLNSRVEAQEKLA